MPKYEKWLVIRDWNEDSKSREGVFALSKFFKLKLLTKKTKIRLYTTIVIATLTYGCEVWTTTSVTKRRISSTWYGGWYADIRDKNWYVEEIVQQRTDRGSRKGSS